MNNGVKISFFGAAGEVTGTNILLESKDAKILFDCGVFQTNDDKEGRNLKPFPYEPPSIQALFVTHAHFDHIGRIPRLVKEGFGAKIFSTLPTKDLARLTLEENFDLLKPRLYGKEVLEKTSALWQALEYGEKISIGGFEIKFLNAGHILGSAMIEIKYGGKKIVFTGDLGNSPNPLLPDAEIVKDADYLIMEGLYGDHRHSDREGRKLKLERFVENTARKKGALMMPVFSLERSQEIISELNDLVEENRVPCLPVFIDSPLAIDILGIYKKYQRYLNEETRQKITRGDDIFKFPGLVLTRASAESKEIENAPLPKIILAGAAMSVGGRILFHEVKYLPDPNSTLLLTTYQAAGTLGRKLKEGAKSVSIFGKPVEVRSRIETIQSYSDHPDYDQLFRFAENSRDSLKNVFLVHGELKPLMFLSQRLRDYLGIYVTIPKYGEGYKLNF